jgi:hypothetical protein
LYTPEAESQEEAIRAFEPELSDDTINGALIQILAEKHVDIKSIDRAVVLHKLREYQSTPWRSFNDMDVKDAANHKRTRRGLELMPRDRRHFMILRQDITLDATFANRDKLTYWPLFFVVSSFLIKNLQEDIPSQLYCYSYDDFGRYSPQSVKETNLYKVDKRQTSTVTSEVYVAQNFVKRMLADGCMAKLADFLQSTDSSAPYSSPNAEELYRKAAILIGAAGWCRIGNEENIKHTLKHMSISFSLGKTKDSLDLASLL